MTIKKYIIFSISTLLLVGCAGEDSTNTPAGERVPLRLQATLSSERPVTRAADKAFADDDKLVCYVRHVTGTEEPYTSVKANSVTFQYGDAGTNLYWDDFSETTDDGSKDLRTDGHGLQSYYGYCYNGGTPSTALDEPTGVLGWTISDDQTTAENLLHSDLLWSRTQAPVTYNHAKDAHGTLAVPFTHAMSKFTIVIVAGDGFKADDLDAATVTLSGMNQTGTFAAPDATVSSTSGPASVKMFGNSKTTSEAGTPCRAYEAVTVPLTELTSGNLLASIQSMAGNTYEVKLTDAMLASWAAGLTEGKTQSGYNYKLTVNLKKQTVGVVASLTDWNDVSATGTAEIQFTADVKTVDKSNDATLKSGDSFSLWMTTDKADFGDVATTAAYNGAVFENTPAIYWPNGSDNYYFRALAQKTSSKTLDAVKEKKATQGVDLLWGTTAAHEGTLADNTTVSYEEGAAINPRTGEVPLMFKHIMSHVVINLTTTTDASKVDLTDATVTLTRLYTEGDVDIATGDMKVGDAKTEKALDKATNTNQLMMIPQTIDDETRMVITLKDGTTYSLQLNKCEDASNAVITTWKRGNRYTYTISLQKEAVKFRVEVQDWTPAAGSGNATLDWD